MYDPVDNVWHDCEQAALGYAILEGDGVSDWKAFTFTAPQHKLILSAIQRVAALGKPVDVVTVAEDLSDKGELDRAGGLAYLGALVQGAQTPYIDNRLH